MSSALLTTFGLVIVFVLIPIVLVGGFFAARAGYRLGRRNCGDVLESGWPGTGQSKTTTMDGKWRFDGREWHRTDN